MELLKISIKARIEDFDRFYDKNFQDFRISFFEKQKFRLRKLLHEASVSSAKEKEEIPQNESNELEIKFQIEDDVNMYTMQKSSMRNLMVGLFEIKIILRKEVLINIQGYQGDILLKLIQNVKLSKIMRLFIPLK